jgi:hypothetical protein
LRELAIAHLAPGSYTVTVTLRDARCAHATISMHANEVKVLPLTFE